MYRTAGTALTVIVCMYRTAGTALTVIVCMYRTAGTAVTVITINSSLAQCTVGADRMLTDVCAISCKLSTVHIVTQCDIKTTNLPYTQHTLSQPTVTLYNTHLYWTALKGNFNCRLFTVRWQPTFPLLLLTHQHTDCSSLHKQHNFCVTITWAQVLCAAVALNTSQLRTHSVLIQGGNWCLSHSYFNVCKGNSNTHCGTVTLLLSCCHSLLLIYQQNLSSGQQVPKFSLLIDQFHFVRPSLRHVFFFGNWGKTG
jgi:hypothetical protein